MNLIIFITVTVAATNVFCYHDPDLNYHLNQVQKITPNCDNGYAYPAPSVQLSTSGVKYSAPTYIPPQVSAPLGYASTGYSTGITYAAQPAQTYQTSSLLSNYATNEAHGYATSAGLSAVSQRPIIPSATYAQAPIIAKITGSPLIAKFAQAPAKTTYTTQNLITQQAVSSGSLAKASLNSYSNVQAGGPVVSQVYAAPSVRYTASPALRVQTQQIGGYSVATPGVQYAQAGNVGQYMTSSLSQLSAPATSAYFSPAQRVAQYAAPVAQYAQTVQHAPAAPAFSQYAAPAVAQYSTRYSAPTVSQYATQHASSQYAAPAVSQYLAPAVTQYSAPAVPQYAAPAVPRYAAPAVAQYAGPAVAQYSAPTVTHYSTPAVTHYSSPAAQYSSPAVAQYSSPAVAQYSSPAVAQYSSPAVAAVSQYSAPSSVTHHVSAPAVAKIATGGLAGKNVHTDFLENYDAHPRYAYEYGVNDPHTGDIKQQKEERDGEVVKGQYSLVEPDGSVRTVNYVADWDTGFHAEVRNSKDNQH